MSETALVIGGGRGIGKAIALRLAKDGFEVVATGRQEGPLSELEKEAALSGWKIRKLLFDVSDRENAARQLENLYGDSTPDVLVYNAGIARDTLFALMTPEEWDSVINTNLNGFYNCVHPLLMNMMGRRKGRIIVIGSASGETGQAGQVNYSAAKAGLSGAVKALAREVGRKGILVNAVAPGVIETDMTKDLPAERILPLIPLNRIGHAEEVASVVAFLSGPDSSYIHGQVLSVNGGLVI